MIEYQQSQWAMRSFGPEAEPRKTYDYGVVGAQGKGEWVDGKLTKKGTYHQIQDQKDRSGR